LDIESATLDESSVQFGPVAELDTAVETLDLPVASTDRPERNLAVTGAALALALSFLLVPLGLVVSPAVNTPELAGLAVALGPMFIIPVVALIWGALRWV
jgi:hypothetical protein